MLLWTCACISTYAFSYLECIPGSGMTGSHSNWMFILWGNCQLTLQNSCIILLMYEDSNFFTSLLVFPIVCLYIVTGILMAVLWYSIVVLICTYLIANGTEQLFMFSLPIVHLWGKYFLKSLPIFQLGCLFNVLWSKQEGKYLQTIW